MQSSSCSSQPAKPRRFDAGRRTNTSTGPKSHGAGFQREDKNMNTIPSASPRRVAKGPAATSRTRTGVQPRAPAGQTRFGSQKPGSTTTKALKPKPKTARGSAASRVAPAAPPLPTALPLDPNCNEPSLPCLCCDGRSPQDSNSMFNHNHNNNNTVSLRQQLQLPPPPPPALLPQRQDGAAGAKERPRQPPVGSPSRAQPEPAAAAPENEGENVENVESVQLDNKKDEDESSGDVDLDDDEEGVLDNDEDDDEDDDTLVPSCCDCPPSLLEFSLSSSTSSSSTSISSCSDLESDCADQSASVCSSFDQNDAPIPASPKDPPRPKSPEIQPLARPPPSRYLSSNPFSSRSPVSSPDEGYPSALDSPSPDYLGVKEDSEVTKLGLLDFLESVGEFGKMERFSQVIQVARWDLEGEQHWDVLRDRLDHLDRLEKVNREVKLAHVARLHERGCDLGDLDEQDLSDVMDEMGNIDIPWKLYKNRAGTMAESQEFSDAGVDLTAPSDCDDPLAPDSLTPSPVELPPRPPKPPARHASVNSDLHTYINISRETTSMAVSTSPTLLTFSPNSSSPTFTTFRCEKNPSPSPPSVPPLPSSKPVPYLTLYTTSSPPPAIPTPTPPIPPPRKRHLARKEAQRLAALQAERDKTPLSLPPPTTRPPPLPPPPVISISSSLSPPEIPPPPVLPAPPSFHALDVEIRKLLMLAGLTQAELLKLSPELSVCVGGLDEEREEEDILSRSIERQEFKRSDEEEQEEEELTARDGWSGGGKFLEDEGVDIRGDAAGGAKTEESREEQRTTSFTEMARRRKRNTSDLYYCTGLSSTHGAKSRDVNFDEVPSSPPPPPPPRPLPPIPPSQALLRVSTLPANSAQPERFDWLIAFTPDGDAPPGSPPSEIVEAVRRSATSGPSSAGAPKVTFRDLRFRNKCGPPPTKVITDPEPDPAVITPDPDILYNLKWRREKPGSEGPQWEYTSQAKALFMEPPPALTSMAALKEMLQRAGEEGARTDWCPGQKMGCSVSDGSLWTTGREWEEDDLGKDDAQRGVGARGRADGGRTLESRTSVSSPPLSLAQSSQPYFLHPDPPTSLRPGFCNPTDSRPHTHVGRESPPGSWWADADDPSSSVDVRSVADPDNRNVFSPDTRSETWFFRDSIGNDGSVTNDSLYKFDSLYDGDSEEQSAAARTRPHTPTRAPGAPACATPYKNFDVMMTNGAEDSLHTRANRTESDYKTRTSKALPPLPSYYLYHPKTCPLHRGAPPRLSPVGALAPPQRSGAPPPGTAGSCLSSPLFPRSHTLPALAAPFYYPNLYPPVPPRAPPLPPKLYQAPPLSRVATVRSVSFAGTGEREERSWMGEDVKLPMRGAGLSPPRLQEKKALVSAVSVAVEAILAQFSSSRTVVQKTLSGDSAVNPSLGRLVLQCLGPALLSLLTDGLKPHQSDLIAGRRPNSAWSLVQASTRPGPKTQALFNLQVRVGQLPQLRRSEHRFNAFLLGLLNSKLLDMWLSHLQSCRDVLDSYYFPSSFMCLSLTACQPVFEELLLVLQPLSLLTFNLDLLFQHHHLEPDSRSPDVHSPTGQDAGLRPATRGPRSKVPSSSYIETLSEVNFESQEHPTPSSAESKDAPTKVSLGQTSPQLMWVQEKEIGELPPPNIEEDSLAQQAGQVIQQGWGAVMRWGGRLSQNLADLSLSAGKLADVKTGLHELQAQPRSDFAPLSSAAQVPWGLGRLFGASKGPGGPMGHAPPTRRPSQWLAPGVTALTRMVSSSSTPILRKTPDSLGEQESEREADTLELRDEPRPLRSVRTLCDHVGSGRELSFCKGEELIVLGGVDQDWIRCRQGNQEGLVPIGYTSLIM